MQPDYIDIHAHLNFAAYDADREEVVVRTLAENVHVINVGTEQATSKSAVELARMHEGLYAAIGLHPTHTAASHSDPSEFGAGNDTVAATGETFDYEYYKALAADPKVVAIGECGLDYFRLDTDTAARQKAAFEAEIALANGLGKPLMLHIRNGSEGNAYADALEMLRTLATVRGDVHFFAGDWDTARSFLELGFTLSFTGVITFARNYDEVVRNAPLDMIMAETDCPYVAPAPFRGKRNEPLHVREVYKKIAEIRGEDEEMVRRQVVATASNLFGLK
jgi:TatD DNase family protein